MKTEKFFCFFINRLGIVWFWLSDLETDAALGSVELRSYDKN